MKEAIIERFTHENIGFDLRQAADYHSSLIRKRNNLEERTEEMARDLRSYESESLEDNIFSFYPYYIKQFEGEDRIFSSKISSAETLAISQIDDRERDGAVREGFKKIEDKIPYDGFFLWISLDGESGFKNINYRYHQIYLADIQNKEIQAAALKCDIDKAILAEWLTKVSNNKVKLGDFSAKSFVTTPFISEMGDSQSALRALEEVLMRHNTDKFYKNETIDDVILKIHSEKVRQERDVWKLSYELQQELRFNKNTPEKFENLLGNRLYNLFSSYKDRNGNVVLTGCAGGTMSINELFKDPRTAAEIPIFSTQFRMSTAGQITKSEDDYSFDHEGECVVCHKDPILLGPCDICVNCDAKMGGKASKKSYG